MIAITRVMTTEEVLKSIIAEQTFQIAQLASQVSILTDENNKLKSSLPKKKVKKEL